MTTMYWLAFALGGAVGAMGRAGIAATLTAGAGFPWHTFAANVIGSVAIGLIWAALNRAEAAPLWSAFLITGAWGSWIRCCSLSKASQALDAHGRVGAGFSRARHTFAHQHDAFSR